MSDGSVIPIEGVVRAYEWGSLTAIPELLGVPPSGEPQAELWFGAHPDDPAHAPDQGTTLDRLIAEDPEAMLGADVVGRFGPRLPFLLKILAARTALSLQVHPNLEQAEAGFAAEEAAGVDRSSPQRVYHDPNHKPEMVCALTEFDALCGFRPVAQTLRLLDSLDIPELAAYRTLLAGSDGLRAAFTALLAAADASLVDAVVAACRARLDTAGVWTTALNAVLLAADDFPGDVGCVLALLLNAVRLAPGDVLYLDAGNVHAYLRGVGVEVMASSDNVLRCGLTGKHRDVPEVLRVTSFQELAEPIFGRLDGFADSELSPVADFAFGLVDLDAFKGAAAVGAHGPLILLCLQGAVRIQLDDESAALTPGHAAFVAARERAVTVNGTGRICYATTESSAGRKT